MLLTQKECILTNILNCGYGDLEMLEDINYDLDETIETLKENDLLNLNNIFKDVFHRGVSDLQYSLNSKADDIINLIKEKMNEKIHLLLDHGESLTSLENDDDWKELLKDYRLLLDNQLNPSEQFDYYCNYRNTYVYIEHLYFYKKWLNEDLDEIEHNMGFTFNVKNY